MSLTAENIADMTFPERCAAAAYKLNWQEAPEGLAWDSWQPGWREIIRWILWPILEPPIETSPRTVYCGAVASTSTALVSEALIDAGLNDAYPSEHDALGACLAVWAGV